MMSRGMCLVGVTMVCLVTTAYCAPTPQLTKDQLLVLFNQFLLSGGAPQQFPVVDRPDEAAQLQNLVLDGQGGEEGEEGEEGTVKPGGEAGGAVKRAQYQYICFDKWRRVKLCSGRV